MIIVFCLLSRASNLTEFVHTYFTLCPYNYLERRNVINVLEEWLIIEYFDIGMYHVCPYLLELVPIRIY